MESTSALCPTPSSNELLGWLKSDPRAIAKAKAELYRRSPLIWLFGAPGLPAQVRTRDEHDPDFEAKPFPDKPYIREMVRLWQAHRMNIWEKSRQVMASWTLCALYLHDTQFGTNRLNFIQSKKELDSDALLRRCFSFGNTKSHGSKSFTRPNIRTATFASIGRVRRRTAGFRTRNCSPFRRAKT